VSIVAEQFTTDFLQCSMHNNNIIIIHTGKKANACESCSLYNIICKLTSSDYIINNNNNKK